MSQCGKEEACANAENCGACSRRYDDRFLDKNSFKIEESQLTKDLEWVEDVMSKSGIREFCSNVCKGQCCNNCERRPADRCFNGGPRNLGCSTYICSELKQWLVITIHGFDTTPFKSSWARCYNIHSLQEHIQNTNRHYEHKTNWDFKKIKKSLEIARKLPGKKSLCIKMEEAVKSNRNVLYCKNGLDVRIEDMNNAQKRYEEACKSNKFMEKAFKEINQ